MASFFVCDWTKKRLERLLGAEVLINIKGGQVYAGTVYGYSTSSCRLKILIRMAGHFYLVSGVTKIFRRD